MPHLSHDDQNAVLEALRELYGQTDLDSLRELMVRLAARLVGNDWASYNEFTRDDYRLLVNFRIPDSAVIRTRAPSLFACVREHPAYVSESFRPGEACKISDFISWRDFQRTTIYNQYYHHVGVRHQIFVNVCSGVGSGVQRAIALNRRRRDFSERDRDILTLIKPHFDQAYTNALRLDRLQRATTAWPHVQPEFSEIVLSLDSHHRIHGLSEADRTWSKNYLGLSIDEGKLLPEPFLQWARADAVRRERVEFLTEPGPQLGLYGPNGFIHARFLVGPADDRTILQLRFNVPRVAASTPKLPELTPRENEVLGWISRGKSNPEIATILGLSVRTVYKHVENIFAKLGIGSRAQAMVCALEPRP